MQNASLRSSTARQQFRASQPAQLPAVARRNLHVCAAGFGFGKPKADDKKCPCGSGESYAACCQRFHKDKLLKTTTAEQTLRARFSAYAKGDWRYILRTTHSKAESRKGSTDGKVQTTFEQDVKVTISWTEFLKLAVLDKKAVAPGEGVAGGAEPEELIDLELQFKQLYELKTGEKAKNPPVQTMRETARFVKEDGEWMFLKSEASTWDRTKLTNK